MRWNRIAIAAGTIVAALAAAPSALAATASTSNAGGRYVAAPGELNQVVIESFPPPLVFRTVIFRDSVPITPVSPCIPQGATAAECPLPEGPEPPVVVELGDQGDQAIVQGQPYGVTTVMAGPGDDRFEMAPSTTLPGEFHGEDGNDYGVGGPGADRLLGGGGNDRLFGGDGGNRLTGGDGDDRLYGGANADRLDGGPGNDWLTGGNGRDRPRGQDGDDYIRVSDSESNISDIVSCGGGSDRVIANERDRVRSDCERVRIRG